jgi:hypothetical protein
VHASREKGFLQFAARLSQYMQRFCVGGSVHWKILFVLIDYGTFALGEAWKS